ncbi:hypothetical protein [Tomitella cavernea]|uniref:FUSC family protein n=1 Tax=Tomitella cavernea TaxID=1387982 RepID=A0ABP9C9D9_9ACTN|nr:hypothetical protein [Tomitella cavernea]
MTSPGHEDRDVRGLLGMRSTAAHALVAAYVLTFLLVSLKAGPGSGIGVDIAAWAAVSAGAVVLVRAPGDPLPLGAAIGVVLAGPAALNLVLIAVPVPIDSLLQLWPLAAATALYTFLCVRGRMPMAWIGMAMTIASCMAWAQRTGQGAGYGFAISAINLAPLLMATFFTWTIRPAARNIFALRDQTVLRVADEAAATAILLERDEQLQRLDRLARPLLERIAAGEPLTDGERLASSLLEAHLRDTIRAPGLNTPALTRAAHGARERGVELILLDDHGMDEAPAEVRTRVHTVLERVLDSVTGGNVTVRVLPPHRAALVTILHGGDATVTRITLGHDGHRVLEPGRD